MRSRYCSCRNARACGEPGRLMQTEMISDRMDAQHPEYEQHYGYRTNDRKQDRDELREPESRGPSPPTR
jgi:hypothetical protein